MDGYSYDIMADDVKVVLDTLILDAALVGFSMGGAISIRYIVRHNGSHIKTRTLSYFYCGSIVAGGLLDTAYVTQVTPSTSFVILLLIFSINS